MPQLEIRAAHPLLVRREKMIAGGSGTPYKILYASDLHFLGNGSWRVADQLFDAVRQQQPDIVLLGGDLIDLKPGLAILTQFISAAQNIAPLWAIRGNHDAVVPKAELQRSIESAGGNWLEGRSLKITDKKGLSIKIDGQLSQSSPLLESHDFPVLCAHNPAIFPHAARLHYSLVLAGHLHGCQCVLWQKEQKLFPGAWFYKWNGLRFQENKTTMLVSRGLSDTLPIRWNCPREVLLCEIY